MNPNQCLLLLSEQLLLVISNQSDLLFISMPSFSILKTDVLDELSSVQKIEIDQQENLLLACDGTPLNAFNVSTFQINIKYKMIIYGSGLQIFFTDYSQKKLINQIQLTKGAQGGVEDYQTNILFAFTNKIYQYDLEANNLIQPYQRLQHLKIDIFCSQICTTTPSLYLLIHWADHNPFNKFNHFQLLRLHAHNYIQRKKKDSQTPFFKNKEYYDCKIPKIDFSSFTNNGQQTYPSFRNILLLQRFQNINFSEKNSFKECDQSPDGFQGCKGNKQKTFNVDATSSNFKDSLNSLEISSPQDSVFKQNYQFTTKSNAKNITIDIDSSKFKSNLLELSKQSYLLSTENPNNQTDFDSPENKIQKTFKEK
ncbi:hypothetical protein ABPG72_000582 [Tetrahymena utriculariae]